MYEWFFIADTGRVVFDDSRLLGCDGTSLGELFVIFKRVVLPPVVWVKLTHPTMQLYVPEDESVITPRCNPQGLQGYFSLPQHVEWLWCFASLVSSYQGFLPWQWNIQRREWPLTFYFCFRNMWHYTCIFPICLNGVVLDEAQGLCTVLRRVLYGCQ